MTPMNGRQITLRFCSHAEPPRVLHYGLLFEVKGHGFAFDKAWFHDFDPQQCTPWDLSLDRPTAGLLPLPPSPSTFTEVTVHYSILLHHAKSPAVNFVPGTWVDSDACTFLQKQGPDAEMPVVSCIW